MKELLQKLKASLVKVNYPKPNGELSETELQDIYDRCSWNIYESSCYYLGSEDEGKKMLKRIFDRARKEMDKGSLKDEDFQLSRIASDEINLRWKELGKLPDKLRIGK